MATNQCPMTKTNVALTIEYFLTLGLLVKFSKDDPKMGKMTQKMGKIFERLDMASLFASAPKMLPADKHACYATAEKQFNKKFSIY